jgi:hypothetical protein
VAAKRILVTRNLNVLNQRQDDSLHPLDFGASDLLMLRPTPADQNLCSREWTRVVVDGSGPGGRYYHTVMMIRSELFVLGGAIGAGKLFNDVWALDLNV